MGLPLKLVKPVIAPTCVLAILCWRIGKARTEEQKHDREQIALALSYMQQKNIPHPFERAGEILLPLAKKGESVAQYYVGLLCEDGTGLPHSEEDALMWIQRAAEQGCIEAELHLGALYAVGRSVPQSYEKAIKWFLPAASQGNANAQFVLGTRFKDGKGGVRSVPEAKKWLGLATAQGHLEAECNLGLLYIEDGGASFAAQGSRCWQCHSKKLFGGKRISGCHQNAHQ